jgi:Tol biopolymer transport system component
MTAPTPRQRPASATPSASQQATPLRLLLVAMLAAACQDGTSPTAPDGGASYRKVGSHQPEYRKAGGGPQELVGVEPGGMGAPLVGGRIVYSHGVYSTAQLFTMGYNGGDRQQLTTGTEPALEPAWSPDYTRIAYVLRTATGEHRLATVGADGKHQQVLTTMPGVMSAPRWSPDGKTLVFSYRPGGANRSDVVRIPAAGGPLTLLTNDVFGGRDAVFTRDGQRLVYASPRVSRDGAQWDLFTMSATTGQLGTRLTNTAEDETEPALSPDGTRLLFHRAAYDANGQSVQHRIVLAKADGSAERTLVALLNGPVVSSPTWSRDASMAVWAHRPNGGAGELVRAYVDGAPLPTSLTGQVAPAPTAPNWAY